MIKPENDVVEVYEDGAGLFRWRRVDPENGLIVSESSQGYVRRTYAEDAANAYNAPYASLEHQQTSR